MGKASNKRRKRRAEFFAQLAITNPAKFRKEWTKRLASWSDEAFNRATHLIDSDGKLMPAAFRLVDCALAELMACGSEAVALEARATQETMTDACCRAISQARDTRLYHLHVTYPKQLNSENEQPCDLT